MKLCEDQKIIIVLALTAIVAVLTVFFCVQWVKETLSATVIAVIAAFIAIEISVSVAALSYLFPIRRQKKEKQQRELNNEVFKKWKEVTVNHNGFQVEYAFKTPIDPAFYEKGKRFLFSSKDTLSIITTWNKLDNMKTEYRRIGNTIREAVSQNFSGAYSSLKELLEFSESVYGNCFVISNILKLLSDNSSRLVNDEAIEWAKLIRLEKYIDTSIPLFRLVAEGVLIQSRNQNDVDMLKFQKVIEILKPKIVSHLRRLTALDNSIAINMAEFIGKIDQLSNDIDL